MSWGSSAFLAEALSPVEETINGTRLELGDNVRVAALSTFGISSDLLLLSTAIAWVACGVLQIKANEVNKLKVVLFE